MLCKANDLKCFVNFVNFKTKEGVFENSKMQQQQKCNSKKMKVEIKEWNKIKWRNIILNKQAQRWKERKKERWKEREKRKRKKKERKKERKKSKKE